MSSWRDEVNNRLVYLALGYMLDWEVLGSRTLWSRTEVQWVRTVDRTKSYVEERRGKVGRGEGLAITQTLSVSDGCPVLTYYCPDPLYLCPAPICPNLSSVVLTP